MGAHLTKARRMGTIDIYGGRDPKKVPAYSITSAARYLQLPATTVRDWVAGRTFPTKAGVGRSAPIILAADPDRYILSFQNLVEVYVLSAIRRERVPLDRVRRAVENLSKEFHTDHPLADKEIFTVGRSMVIDELGKVVDAASGQLSIRRVVAAHLKRIEKDPHGVPIRIYPSSTGVAAAPGRAIAIDPRVQFGRPCIAKTSVPTEIVASRYKAGDSREALARDYRLTVDQIEEALRYEIPRQAA